MTTIRIEQQGSRWIARYPFDRDINAAIKAVGFRFDGMGKYWWTADAKIAKAVEGDSAELVARLNAARQAQHAKDRESIEASRATDAAIDVPVPAGLRYKPYQLACIAYAMGRPNILIGDEMGLGKTIEAIGIINADPSVKTVLVICPVTPKLNWKNELTKWLVRPMSIEIANGGELPQADVVIVNYEQLAKFRAAIEARHWDVLIADECHYIKNPKAQRTQLILGRWDRDPAKRKEPIKAGRKLFLTGTPFLNRPIELWPLVQALDPQGLGKSRWNFGVRYCDGHPTRWTKLDVTGASNLDELGAKLRSSFMIRRRKAEVLTELAPKLRQVIPLKLETREARDAVTAENAVQERLDELRAAVELSKASDDPAVYEAAVAALKEAEKVAFSEVSKTRLRVALAKLPQLIAHLEDCVENGKVVVMIHHHEVAHALAEHFGEAAFVLTGETAQKDRMAGVNRFQTDESCKLFIGSIGAAGVAITLTAASLVVFGELDFTPGRMSQAEDRCHRIGQKDQVQVQHLVLDGSYDQRIATMLIEKQANLDAALDDQERLPEVELLKAPVASTVAAAATRTVTQEQVAKEAVQIAPEVIEAVHAALAALSARCDGAHDLDGAGFNRMDTRIGKNLAAQARLTPKQAVLGKKIVQKYHRQLPAALMQIIKGA